MSERGKRVKVRIAQKVTDAIAGDLNSTTEGEQEFSAEGEMDDAQIFRDRG